MPAPAVIVVNGILTAPGDARAWTDRAVTWLHCDAAVAVQAEKFEYYATALTRRLRQQRHARELAHLIELYKGREVHLVGHSNGCDIILRALALTRDRIASVHLIAGACEEDFEKNGLNALLYTRQIGAVHAYTSPDDRVLAYAARPSRALFGWMGLGYGLLGLVGPTKITPPVRHLVSRWDRPGYGHSTWFSPENFDATLNLILRHAQLV